MFGNQKNHFNYGYPGQMMQRIPSNYENTTGFINNQAYPYPNQSPNQNLSQNQHNQWQPYQPPNQYYQGVIQPQNPYHQGGIQPPNTYYQAEIQPQNPYYQGGYPINQAPPQGSMQNQHSLTKPIYSPKDSQFLFQNPLQPQEEMYPNQYPQTNGYPNMNPYPNQNMNPYPKQNMMLKQPGGMQSLMNSFKSQDGSVDYNKMMNTAGQMMTAVNQVSSLVKGLGGIFKV